MIFGNFLLLFITVSFFLVIYVIPNKPGCIQICATHILHNSIHEVQLAFSLRSLSLMDEGKLQCYYFT